MKRIRYGLIGFGGIAENRIAKEGFACDSSRFSGHPHADLVVAWDPNEARAQAAKALGITWVRSVQEILQDKTIDAIVVASNNSSHAYWGLEALKAGKHILIEKPAGVTESEVMELVREARTRKLSFGVDHMMTKNVYSDLAKSLITAGIIGDIDSITLHMEFPFGFTPEEAATWRCANPVELGGPIGDVGSHCFYMAEHLLDSQITSLKCVYIPKTLAIPVEDGAFIEFTTEKGITGTARVAFNQKRGSLGGTLLNLGYEIYGTKGFLEGKGTMFQLSGHEDEPVSLSLTSYVENKITSHVPKNIENIYARQISEHALSIIEGNPIDGEAALRNLRMILLSHESAQTGGSTLVV